MLGCCWLPLLLMPLTLTLSYFRNCLVGKCYHIKICDFGSDCPTYKKDYVEMEDMLLVPLRWMAWESVIEVRMANIGRS